MSLTCPTSPVYHTSAQQKLQSRNAAKIYRYGSPRLRDLLREKCRVRVREARQLCFENSRNKGDGGVQKNLDINEILRQELAQVEDDINLQEQIYKELLDEVNEWFAEQQEQEESYLINESENNELICPICQRAALVCGGAGTGVRNGFKCKCQASFAYNGDMEQLRAALQIKIDAHEQRCLHALSFFVEPQSFGDNALNAMCESCDYFCSL